MLDRYIKIFDRAVHDAGAVEEFRSVYAPGASVQLDERAGR
ncbi:hypothetical protein [Amycolatopsis mediterranei]|nr:hypothetical protein [Amycolatopsis mediterranei]